VIRTRTISIGRLPACTVSGVAVANPSCNEVDQQIGREAIARRAAILYPAGHDESRTHSQIPDSTVGAQDRPVVAQPAPMLCLAESSAERNVTIFRVFEPHSALQYWVDAPSERDARRMVSMQVPTVSEEEIECRIDTPDLPVPYGVVVVSRKTKEQSGQSHATRS
jgi:hypothetical protein